MGTCATEPAGAKEYRARVVQTACGVILTMSLAPRATAMCSTLEMVGTASPPSSRQACSVMPPWLRLDPCGAVVGLRIVAGCSDDGR